MSAEAKVGVFTLAGLITVIAAVVWLGHFQLFDSKGYMVYVGFREAIGLAPQSSVQLSGVPIGTVKDIENDGVGVTVTLDIESKVKIPQGSHITITSTGVMGEKFVNIHPGEDFGEYLQNGDYVIGVNETTMEVMFDNMNKTVLQVREMLASMNSIVGDPLLKKSLLEMSVNMNQATANIAGMTGSLERMALGSEENVQQAVRQLNVVLSGMERTMASVEHMMANIDSVAGDPQVAENMRTTLQNITVTSEKVAQIADNIHQITGDPQTVEDAKAIIHNARSITERADKMMGGVSKIGVKPSVDVLYSGGAHRWSANANVEIGVPDGPFLALGLDDIGEDNLVNAQVGKKFGAIGARAGVVASKPGIGLDAYAGDRFKFSADAYNMNDATLRLRAQYRIAGGTYLMGQWNEVNHGEKRKAFVGVKQEF